MLAPSPLTSKFMGVAGFVPAISHKLPDGDGESDGSSIGAWHPATVRPGSALWRTLRDNRQWLRSLCKLTPLWTRVREPSHLRKHTLRNYDNDGRISRRLHWRCRYSTLCPTRLAWRVALGVALVRFSTTS